MSGTKTAQEEGSFNSAYEKLLVDFLNIQIVKIASDQKVAGYSVSQAQYNRRRDAYYAHLKRLSLELVSGKHAFKRLLGLKAILSKISGGIKKNYQEPYLSRLSQKLKSFEEDLDVVFRHVIPKLDIATPIATARIDGFLSHTPEVVRLNREKYDELKRVVLTPFMKIAKLIPSFHGSSPLSQAGVYTALSELIAQWNWHKKLELGVYVAIVEAERAFGTFHAADKFYRVSILREAFNQTLSRLEHQVNKTYQEDFDCYADKFLSFDGERHVLVDFVDTLSHQSFLYWLAKESVGVFFSRTFVHPEYHLDQAQTVLAYMLPKLPPEMGKQLMRIILESINEVPSNIVLEWLSYPVNTKGQLIVDVLKRCRMNDQAFLIEEAIKTRCEKKRDSRSSSFSDDSEKPSSLMVIRQGIGYRARRRSSGGSTVLSVPSTRACSRASSRPASSAPLSPDLHRKKPLVFHDELTKSFVSVSPPKASSPPRHRPPSAFRRAMKTMQNLASDVLTKPL